MPLLTSNVIFMKYRCVQCNHIFSNNCGVIYDWRIKKKWFMSCPKCGAELHLKHKSIRFSFKFIAMYLISLTVFMSVFILPRFLQYSEVNEKYINIAQSALIILFLIGGLYQHLKAKKSPEKIKDTIINND